jgi:hypothetical protein
MAERQPDRLKVGSLVLISVGGLARDWCVPEETVLKVLRSLGMPACIRWPGSETRYVNLFVLEWRLFELSLPGVMKEDRAWLKALFETQGVIYGTLSREVIKARVQKLAKAMRTKPRKSSKVRRPGRG